MREMNAYDEDNSQPTSSAKDGRKQYVLSLCNARVKQIMNHSVGLSLCPVKIY